MALRCGRSTQERGLRGPRATCATTSRHVHLEEDPRAVGRTRSDWSAPAMLARSGIDRFVLPDVKPGHGLTRVLSFPSPSGWRDR